MSLWPRPLPPPTSLLFTRTHLAWPVGKHTQTHTLTLFWSRVIYYLVLDIHAVEITAFDLLQWTQIALLVLEYWCSSNHVPVAQGKPYRLSWAVSNKTVPFRSNCSAPEYESYSHLLKEQSFEKECDANSLIAPSCCVVAFQFYVRSQVSGPEVIPESKSPTF